MKKNFLLLAVLLLFSTLTFSQKHESIKQHVLIHLDKIPTKQERVELQKHGILLESYFAGTSYYATIDTKLYKAYANSKGGLSTDISEIDINYKLDEFIKEDNIPDYAMETGDVSLLISYFKGAEKQQIISDLKNKLHNTNYDILSDFQTIELNLPKEDIKKLASLSWVKRVECVPPPYQLENDNSRRLIKTNILQQQGIGGRNLSGKGVKIGMWDGNVYQHPDLGDRLHVQQAEKPNSHGQHVSGTLAGAGLLDPKARGMAYQADLYTYNFGTNGAAYMNDAAKKYGIVVTQNSYGGFLDSDCDNPRDYTITDRLLDQVANINPTLLHVFSGGNYQRKCGGVSKFFTSGKRAKNVILVGAVDKVGKMSRFSSWGPTNDGRLLPHIVTDGVKVYSTVYGNLYEQDRWSGTSMACPALSGLATLLYERYQQLYGKKPYATTIKAALLNTAEDKGNVGPDYKFGYGVANGVRAVEVLEKHQFFTGIVGNDETKTFTIENIPANALELRVMVVWNDKEGKTSTKALQNNIDLIVTKNSESYLPWVLNPNYPNEPATKGIDDLNNQEQVVVSNPKGNYTINVKGAKIPSGEQSFSVVYYYTVPELTITFPNGGEKIEPAENVVVRWESEGSDEPTLVQLSYDGGLTFNNIASNVTERYAVVTIPKDAQITDKALIRIIQGNRMDVSDKPFTIIGRPKRLTMTMPSCGMSGGKLSWNKVEGAESYNLLKGNVAKGTFTTIKENITGTTCDLPELTQGVRNVFTVQAVKGTAKSRRALAVIANSAESIVLGDDQKAFVENFRKTPSPYVQTSTDENIHFTYTYSFAAQKAQMLLFEAYEGYQGNWNSSDIFSNKNQTGEVNMCVDATNVSSKDKLWFRLYGLIKNASKTETTAGLKLMVGNEVIPNANGDKVITEFTDDDLSQSRWDLSKYIGQKFNITIKVAAKTRVVAYNKVLGDLIQIGHFKLFTTNNDLWLRDVELPKSSSNLTSEEPFSIIMKNNTDKDINNYTVNVFVNDEQVISEDAHLRIPAFSMKRYNLKTKLDLSQPEQRYIVKVQVDYPNDSDLDNNVMQDTVYNFGDYFLIPKEGSDDVVKTVSDKIKFADDGASMLNYSNNYTGLVTFKPANSGKNIKVSFNEFELVGKDYLMVFDGKNTDPSNSHVLAKLTGKITEPITFISDNSDNSLCFLFVSNNKNNAAGWIADVEETTESATHQYDNNLISVDAKYAIQNSSGNYTSAQPLNIEITNNTPNKLTDVNIEYAVTGKGWVTSAVTELKAGTNKYNLGDIDIAEAGSYDVTVKISHNDEAYLKDNVSSKQVVNSKYCESTARGAGIYGDKQMLITKVQKDDVENITSSTKWGSISAQDFTNIILPINANMPNQEINVDVAYSNDKTKISLWIDWNDNGNLTDAGEHILVSCQEGQTSYAIPIQVPAGVSEGIYFMRAKATTGEDSNDPCSKTAYVKLGSSEIEDYSVEVIKNNITKDVSPIASNLKDGKLTNAETVKVTIKNNANQAVSNFNVSLKTDESASVTETVTATIEAGKTYEYTFQAKANLSEQGLHTIAITTNLTGDEDADNDRLIVEVINNKIAENGMFALNFDNDNVMLNLGTLGKKNIHTSTYEMWINPTSYGTFADGEVGFGRLFEGKNATIFLCRSHDNYADSSLVVTAEGGIFFTKKNSIELNKPQHIAVTVTLSKVQIYINGEKQEIVEYVPIDVNSQEYNQNNSNYNLWVGNRDDAKRPFKGTIDEIRIWEKVLSKSEIKSGMYQHKKGASGLIAEFSCDEGFYQDKVYSAKYTGELMDANITQSKNSIWYKNDNPLKDITVEGQVMNWEINGDDFYTEVKKSVDLSKLTAHFNLNWLNADVKVGSVKQISDVTTNDYSNSLITPVQFNFTADVYGRQLKQTLNVKVKKQQSPLCEITNLQLKGMVNHTFNPIMLSMSHVVESSVDITAIETNFIVSAGATVFVNDAKINSGDNIDYTNPVLFKVVAENGRDMKYYTVSLKKKQVITWDVANITEKYGAADVDLTAISSSGNEIIYETSDENIISIAGQKAQIKGVGTATITAYCIADNKYGDAEPVMKNVIINKADLSIKADDKQIDFSDPIPELTMSFSGFVYDEDKSVIDELPTISTTAKQNDVAGTYTITLSGGNDDHYNLQLTDGNLIITDVDAYNVTFIAKSNGIPESGVNIAINQMNVTTNSQGKATVKLKNGTFDYEATKTGKETVMETVTVNGGDVTEDINIINELPRYTIKYLTDGNGIIKGQSTQFVKKGQSGKEVEAKPKFGCKFIKWDDGKTTPKRQETNVQKDQTYKALFSVNKYTLTYTAGAHGKIQGKTTQTVNHGENGTEVLAVADDGYSFFGWSDGVTDNPRVDKEVTADVNVTANFIDSYKTPYEQPFDKTDAPISWSVVDNVTSGNSVEWKFGNKTLGYGTSFKGATGNFAYVEDERYKKADAELISPTFDFSGNSTVTLEFKHLFETMFSSPSTATLYYSISNREYVKIKEWTTRTKNPEEFKMQIDGVAGESSVRFIWRYVSPKKSYYWAIDDVKLTGEEAAATHIYKYTAGLNGYLKGADANGEISGTKDHGAQGPVVEAVANSGYHFAGWSDGATDNPRQDKINKDINVEAIFASDCETITALPYVEDFEDDTECWGMPLNANGHQWSVGKAIVSIGAGKSANFDASAMGLTSLETAELISPKFDLASHKTVYLSFQYLYFALSASGGVGVKLYYSLDNGGAWKEVKGFPKKMMNPDYFVAKIDKTSSQMRFKWQIKTNGLVSLMVDNVSVRAEETVLLNYGAKKEKINGEWKDLGAIKGGAVQMLVKGSDGKPVTAVPVAEGYRFSKWSDGNTSATRTDKNITENTYFEAEFVKDNSKYTVNYEVEGEHGNIKAEVNGKEITSGSSFVVGTSVKFTATPEEGYVVNEWKENGVVQEGETKKIFNFFGLSEDVTVTVSFKIPTGINDNEAGKVKIIPNPFHNQLTIQDVNNVSKVEIYSMAGVLIKSVNNISGENIEINTSDITQGIYLVKVITQQGKVYFEKVVKE